MEFHSYSHTTTGVGTMGIVRGVLIIGQPCTNRKKVSLLNLISKNIESRRCIKIPQVNYHILNGRGLFREEQEQLVD
jgi:hypothetical protein